MGVSADSCKGAGIGAVSLLLLVVENQAVMIPEEDLDPIATAVEKQEEMASQGVLAKVFSNQAGEAIEALAHIGGPGTEKDAHRGGELGKHQEAPWREPPSEPTAWIAARTKRGLSTPRSRTTQALVSSISTCVPASGSRIDTGTKFGDATPADVVKLNTSVVNYKPADLPIIREARAQICTGDKLPASTLIGVQALAFDGLLIEIEAITVIK